MVLRILTTSALAVLLAGPAFAACTDEIAKLDPAITQAATGEAATSSDMPASKHQENVLAGAKEQAGAATGAGADAVPGQVDVPATEHQEQVTGLADAKQQADVTTLLDRAKQQADAGEEQACMQTVSQIENQLGMN